MELEFSSNSSQKSRLNQDIQDLPQRKSFLVAKSRKKSECAHVELKYL